MLHYSDMMQALTINYLNVYVVDPKEDRGDIIKLQGYITKGIDQVKGDLSYSRMLRRYMEDRVFSSDHETFWKALEPKALEAAFSDGKDQIEFSYRAVEGKKIHYYLAHYIRISKPEDPILLVAGFRNIDDIVHDQVRNHNVGLNRAYNALSSLYLTMHRVDIIEDEFYEIKSQDHVRNAQIPGSNHFVENIRKVMKEFATVPFQDELMEFVDIKTLPERLKDRDYISMEFLGKSYGWCKIRFIKEAEDEDGNLRYVILAVRIIDEDKKREDRLKRLAEIDPLTGIFNRGSGEWKMQKFINEGVSGLVCLIDLDNFKSINDNYGHGVGDDVLIEVARILKSVCKEGDMAWRFGGDEFALFSVGLTKPEQADALWELIVSKLEAVLIPEMGDRKISLSMGGAFYDGSSEDFETLYKKADEAMYRCKQYKGCKAEFV